MATTRATGLVTEDLVTGLARDTEFPTQRAHLLAFQQAGNEALALAITELPFHGIQTSPRQLPEGGVTHVSGTNGHLCLRTLIKLRTPAAADSSPTPLPDNQARRDRIPASFLTVGSSTSAAYCFVSRLTSATLPLAR
jgi:hypothetical protein